MSLTPGTHLGPYEVEAPVGAGGMGEVYRARDTRLEREVAIKVLPEAVASDGEARARFEREAKAVASLSHPNILAIHDFGLEDGVAFAVTELLEGETLRGCLASGALPPRKALGYAAQIAAGLGAAHDKGIVHRDIKPENVFITRDERVKILDFGLAKRGSGPVTGDGSESPTVSMHTEPGTVMGTVGYMSPEQVRGGAVDWRSDIFSFGVVLFEMLTGRGPFQRATAVETMTAILREEAPDLEGTRGGVAPALGRIVRHCLEKEPQHRFQAIADAAFDLKGVDVQAIADKVDGERSPVARRGARLLWALILVVVGGALGAGVVDWLQPTSPEPARVRSLSFSGHDGEPSASPDGRLVAFTSTRDGVSRIWIKQLSGGEAPLTSGPDQKPRFSPDGSNVLFLRGESKGSRLAAYRIALVGGEPRKIIDNVTDADWSPDGSRIAFVRLQMGNAGSRTAVLGTADVRGGREHILARVPNFNLRDVRWSPDGREIGAIESVQIGFEPGDELVAVDAESGTLRALSQRTSQPLSGLAWSGSGKELLYAQAGNRMGDSSGALARIVERRVSSQRDRTLFWAPNLFPTIGASKTFTTLDVLGSGRMVFDEIAQRINLREVTIEGSRPGSGGLELTAGSSRDRQPAFSPDGGRIIFSSNRSGNLDLWVLSLDTGALKQLTDDPAQDWDPDFSPDGQHIVWSSDRGGNLEIWIANADGSGARQVTHDGADAENPTMTADGKWIIYGSGDPKKIGIWKVRVDGTGATQLVSGVASNAEVSPDGRYAAYVHWLSGIGLAREIGFVDVTTGRVLPFVIHTPYRTGPSASGILVGRSRWLPDGNTIAWVGEDDKGRTGIFTQDFATSGDTSKTRRKIAGFSSKFVTESFGIAPDGRQVVLSTLRQGSNLMLAEGVAGVEPPLRVGRKN